MMTLVWDLLGQVLFELMFPLSDDVSRWRRPEGEAVCGAHHGVRCDLVFGGSVQNPNHDAGIRIDDQAPGPRALQEIGPKTMSSAGLPPPPERQDGWSVSPCRTPCRLSGGRRDRLSEPHCRKSRRS